MNTETKPTVTLFAEFYQPLRAQLCRMGVKPAGKGGLRGRWRSFRTEYPDVVYATGLNENPCVFLYLRGGDHQQRYRSLLQHREAIDATLKGAIWKQTTDTSWGMLKSDTPADLKDSEEKLEAARQWMADNLIRLRNTLHPYLGLL